MALAGREPVLKITRPPLRFAVFVGGLAVMPLAPKNIWPPFERLEVKFAGAEPATGEAGTEPITMFTIPELDVEDEAESTAFCAIEIEPALVSLFCRVRLPSFAESIDLPRTVNEPLVLTRVMPPPEPPDEEILRRVKPLELLDKEKLWPDPETSPTTDP